MASYASSCTWFGPNSLLFISEYTPLDQGPILMQEAALLLSLIPCAGLIIGILMHSLILDRINLEPMLLSLAFHQLVIFCVCLSFFSHKNYHFFFFKTDELVCVIICIKCFPFVSDSLHLWLYWRSHSFLTKSV